MSSASADLVSRRTRSAFRDHCSDFGVVRQIERAFENEGFDPATDAEAPEQGWYSDGQRRGTFDRYTHHVDWTDPAAVRPVLDVFEELLSWCSDNEYGNPQREQLTRHLRRDGYQVDEEGRIRGSVASKLAEIPLDALSDPKSILEHLERIAGATDADPPLAISG